MLGADIIRPSTSPWCTPIILVPKRDGSTRLVLDFRKLDSIIVKNAHPLPNIDDIISSPGKARYFSCLDLCSGFYQIKIDEKSKHKTAFSASNQLFEFNVLPFEDDHSALCVSCIQ